MIEGFPILYAFKYWKEINILVETAIGVQIAGVKLIGLEIF